MDNEENIVLDNSNSNIQTNNSTDQPEPIDNGIANQETTSPTPSVIWLLALLLGFIGVHDFVLHKKGRAITHLILFLLGIFAPMFLPILLGARHDGMIVVDANIGIISAYMGYLVIISWFWGLFEAAEYSGKYKKTETKEQKQKSTELSLVTVSRITKVLSIITLVAEISFLAAIIANRACNGSVCDGAAWGIVILVWFSFLPFVGSIISSIYLMVLRTRLGNRSLGDKEKQMSLVALSLFTLSLLFAIICVAMFLVGLRTV